MLKFNRWTLDADAYYVHFQNGFDSYTDPTTNEAVFVPTGPSNTKGIEAESNIVIGYGFSLYLNGSMVPRSIRLARLILTGANGSPILRAILNVRPDMAAQELGRGNLR